MEDYILKVNNLSVALGGEKILDGLSFNVKEGENFVILGPNGAGKTVLLRTLLGLLDNEGEIEWKPGIKIGYVPQRLPFVKDFPLTVEEFFSLKTKSVQKTTDVIRSVGLEDSILKKSMGLLSSGQFQRVLVAWGLLEEPHVLLFDEPTAGIDIGGEETIYNLLGNLKKEKNLTIVLVTHDLNIVFGEADNILCLNHQKICYGAPKEALTSENMARLFGGGVKFFEHQDKD